MWFHFATSQCLLPMERCGLIRLRIWTTPGANGVSQSHTTSTPFSIDELKPRGSDILSGNKAKLFLQASQFTWLRAWYP